MEDYTFKEPKDTGLSPADVPHHFKGISSQEHSLFIAQARAQFSLVLEEVLTIMDFQGYSTSKAYKLGLWLGANNNISQLGETPLTKEEIMRELNFNDVSFRDALRKLISRICKWHDLPLSSKEAA